MKKKILTCFLICILLVTGACAEALIPGGDALGITMRTEGVIVAGFNDVGGSSPAEAAGVQKGDIVRGLLGTEIRTAEDFAAAASLLDGQPAELTVLRGEKELTVSVTPAQNENGAWKLGLMLREGISGVGTLTFYDPESGIYGALGHSISDSETGLILPLYDGSVCSAEIVDVTPGKAGAPGALSGEAQAEPLGDIRINCVCGIFGTGGFDGADVMETGDIKAGKALIRCTLDGDGVGEYEIEVQKVDKSGGSTTAVIRVTDPVLLDKTGGIVQGMSGSPIIQNGRLVGAVTHVFVSDPSSGYGIGIYDMLDAAGKCA